MWTKSRGSVLYLMVGIGIFFVYQIGSVGTPICFDDCTGYTPLMGSSWSHYYSGLSAMFRSWFVPVFFSLFGPYSLASASAIVMAQTYIQFFAWLLFAASLRRFVHGRLAACIVLVLVGGLMFSQDYYRLNQYLLSDSLALSSVLIQWASCLGGRRYLQWARQQQYAQAYTMLYVVTLAVLTAISMGTRDANMMLALAGIAFVVVDTRRGLLSRRPLVILIVLVAVITIGQVHGARIRHSANASNLLFGFVLPNQSARQFFVDHGMPNALADLGPRLPEQAFGKVRAEDINASRERVGPVSTTYLTQFDRVYLEYLVSHPTWVASTAFANRDLIFEQGRSFAMFPQDRRIPGLVTNLLPIEFWLVILGVALTTTASLGGIRRAALPALVCMLGSANALAGFFADLWQPAEMSRHAFIGSIVLRIGAVLALAVMVDIIDDRIKGRTAWTKTRSRPLERLDFDTGDAMRLSHQKIWSQRHESGGVAWN